MHLAFRSKAMADLCNSEAALRAKWGRDRASSTCCLLCILRDLPNLELLRGFPTLVKEPIVLDSDGLLHFEHGRLSQVAARPDHRRLPRTADGELACSKITAMLIVEVNGYGV